MVAPPPRLSRDAALPRHDATVALPGTRPTNPGPPFCAGWPPVSGWYWDSAAALKKLGTHSFVFLWWMALTLWPRPAFEDMTIIPPKLIVINEMFSLIIICNGGFFSEEAYLERKILAVHFRSSLCSLAACTSVFISTKSAKGGQNSKSLKIFEQKPDENDISMVN